MKRYLQTLLVVTVFMKVKKSKVGSRQVTSHRPMDIRKAVRHGISLSLEKGNLVIAVSWVDLVHMLMK